MPTLGISKQQNAIKSFKKTPNTLWGMQAPLQNSLSQVHGLPILSKSLLISTFSLPAENKTIYNEVRQPTHDHSNACYVCFERAHAFYDLFILQGG